MNPTPEEALRWPEYIKRPSAVHMKRMDGPFEVDTDAGHVTCSEGFIAYDPISGHYWPVTVEYARIHYFCVGETL